MSIKLRFAVVLGLLLLAFAGSLLTLHHLERRQAERLVASSRDDRQELLGHWLELTGSSLRQVASDYSLWDEMVRYVEQPDPAWAEINLVPTLASFNFHALWVLKEDGVLVSSFDTTGQGQPVPVPKAELDAVLKREKFPHFFADSPLGLLEIRGAPIQRSADLSRTGPPRGWILVGRLWNMAQMGSLGQLTESEAMLVSPAAVPPPAPGRPFTVRLTHPLLDVRGEPLRMVHLEHEVAALREVVNIDAWEGRIFIGFGAGMIVVLGLSLYFWVLRPLTMIGESISAADTARIKPLLAHGDELGRVAHLIETSILQSSALRTEIEERKRVEEALRSSQEHLRRTLEGRAQLGRDLHDGVIQTLYSTGLGVAAAQKVLRSRPDEAEATLTLCRRTLNDTIRDVRNFITGLEPEEFTRTGLAEIVHHLLASLRSIHPAEYRVEIDPVLADELGTAHKANLLQIMREAASNALRHGQASVLAVSLHRQADEAVLKIDDNGRGFPAQAQPAGGRGLRNLEARAIELDGILAVSARPQGGVSVHVRFPMPPYVHE